MNNRLLMVCVLLAAVLSTKAQNDTMYLMKNGNVINKQSLKAPDLDSIIFYRPTLNDVNNGIFTDTRDGNVYKWVKIGKQVWMAENLKYIPTVTAPSTSSQTTPFYYVYGYFGTNLTDAKATATYSYGVLYNWPAAMNNSATSSINPSGIRGVCPTGWHLPSDTEWTKLTDFVGGLNNAGTKLKATSGWNSDGNGTNESGFTALPGGYLNNGATFVNIGNSSNWWSSTEELALNVWARNIFYDKTSVGSFSVSATLGFSVRCVKD